MISSLEHTSLMVRDLDAAVTSYTQVLGRSPTLRSDEDGVGCVVFTLDTTSFRIVSPTGEGAAGARLRAALAAGGDGLTGLCFEVADLAKMHRRLRRLSLEPETIHTSELTDPTHATKLTRQQTGLSAEIGGGIHVTLVQRITSSTDAAGDTGASDSAIADIDLVVVSTARPVRAAAFYGARLGLELIFDRLMGEGKTRLMQFQCGPQLVEVTHHLSGHDVETPDQPDKLWGIAWAVRDIDATHARLTAAGRNVSAVKTGAKPGTRVCTLRDGTCGVPTLIVQTDPKGA